MKQFSFPPAVCQSSITPPRSRAWAPRGPGRSSQSRVPADRAGERSSSTPAGDVRKSQRSAESPTSAKLCPTPTPMGWGSGARGGWKGKARGCLCLATSVPLGQEPWLSPLPDVRTGSAGWSDTGTQCSGASCVCTPCRGTYDFCSRLFSRVVEEQTALGDRETVCLQSIQKDRGSPS